MHLLTLLVMLIIYGFFKTIDKITDCSDDSEIRHVREFCKSLCFKEETFEYKDCTYLVSTGEAVQIWHNEKTGEIEYYDRYGKRVLTDREKINEKNRIDSIESGWKTVFEYFEDLTERDRCFYKSKYKDLKSGLIYEVTSLDDGEGHSIYVYRDVETKEFIRPTDGEINHRNRMIKYRESYGYDYRIWNWKKELNKRNRRIANFKTMEIYNPVYEHEKKAIEYGYTRSEDCEEFKMPWFGKVDENGKPIVEELPCAE